jgi:hypothetical protein
MKKSDEDFVFPASEYARAALRARVQHLPTLTTSVSSKSVFGGYQYNPVVDVSCWPFLRRFACVHVPLCTPCADAKTVM